MLSIFRRITPKIAPSVSFLARSNFHSDIPLNKEDKPTHFLSYNDKMYPPQTEDETPRPAVKTNLHLNIIEYFVYSSYKHICFLFTLSLYVTRKRISNTVRKRCGTSLV